MPYMPPVNWQNGDYIPAEAYTWLFNQVRNGGATDETVAPIVSNTTTSTYAAVQSAAHAALDSTIATKVDKGEIVLNAQDFGIVGDGTTQDLTALNQMLSTTAGSVTVYFPAPADMYQFGDKLVERDNVTIRADGMDTVLRWSSSPMLKPDATLSGWTFQDVTLDVAGSGAHLIDLSTGGMSNSTFLRCQLRSYVDDGSVIYLRAGGNFIGNRIIGGQVRRRSTGTVPAIDVSTTASGVNSLQVHGGMWFSNGVTNSPMIKMENTSGSSYITNCSFKNLIGEQSPGGLIHMGAANGVVVRGCIDYDQTAYSDDLLLFDTAGGLDSQAVDVDGCGTAGAPVTFPAGKGHLTVTGSGQAHRIGRVFRGGRNGYVNIPGQGRAVVNNGGPALSLREVVGNRTLDTYDHVILASQTGTITLPDPTADVNGGTLPVGREFIVKNVGTATTTVNCDGSATINGSASLTLAAGDVCRAITNGSDWVTI